MPTKLPLQRLFVVFILGFASGLPFSVLGPTLQAWFADANLSVMQVSLVSLIGLPYTYRMFFAPLVDRYAFFGLKRRRAWMISMQLLLGLGIFSLAFLEPNNSFKMMLVFAFLLSVFSALLDAAIDAQRIEYLPQEDYALGAALAVLGYRIAMLIGSGLILVFAYYHGFSEAFKVMALLVLVGLTTAFFSQEPTVAAEAPTGFTAWVGPFRDLLSKKNILWLFGFVFLYKLGEAFTTTTSGIVMPFLRQELQFSIKTIGYVNKVMGISALLAGGLVTGLILRKCSLYKSLLYIGIAQAGSNLLFLALAIYGKVLWMFLLAVFVDNLVAGMGATALVALLMQVVDTKYTATQFSILVGISSLPRILSGPFGAYIQGQVGWVNLFAFACILALLFIPVLIKVKEFCASKASF
ncbi:MAG: hypothetical protein A3F18_04360 [Legionellales bacterium RIFCSPHIGHO2_12_FULL_37_14]|nr:MAG: hypothetical protein A3F18_04360 [Legionellales bacterium RIFCSPHIGHO2_12_FULL_37_14]